MLRVMLVEDDEDFICLFRRALSKIMPTAVLEVLSSPLLAIQVIVAGDRPDLLVTDMMFAGFATGCDVAASARARGIPTMLCSDLNPRFGPPMLVRKVDFLREPAQYVQSTLSPG